MAIANRVEAMASRMEAIATRNKETITGRKVQYSLLLRWEVSVQRR